MTRKNLAIIISIIAIGIVSGMSLFMGCITSPTEPVVEVIGLELSDYPEAFSKDVVIVVGENASEMEKESAQAVAESLKNSTGIKPQVVIEVEITDSDLSNYNLILVGASGSSKLLNIVYNKTDATRVTKEYPGENKGILEIMQNPWDTQKALLIVTGSDETGVKAGSEVLENTEEVKELHVKTLTIGSKDESEEWIRGGTKTSSLLVKLSRKTVTSGEAFIITVKSWTFTGGRETTVDYDAYFKLYLTDNPDAPLRGKKVHVHAEKDEMYAYAGPFDWIITAPEKRGTYLYRVVKKANTEPSYDDYDIMQKVEFEITLQ